MTFINRWMTSKKEAPTNLGSEKEVRMSLGSEKGVHTSLELAKEAHTSLALGKEVPTSLASEKGVHTSSALAKEVLLDSRGILTSTGLNTVSASRTTLAWANETEVEWTRWHRTRDNGRH